MGATLVLLTTRSLLVLLQIRPGKQSNENETAITPNSLFHSKLSIETIFIEILAFRFINYVICSKDTQPVGAILLTNHSVESCSADIGRPFAFRISLSEGAPLYLAADTEEAANRWVAVTSHASKQSDPWLEMSTRNLRLPPSSIPRPDCFGYLLKLGNRWRTWSKRYCVLKDACLYFYLDGSSKNALGN